MTPSATRSVIDDDLCYYPNHEEDDVPEGTLHQRWSDYLVYALDARFPDQFVAGNICIYWERGNPRDYISPDAFVAAADVSGPTPRVYRLWAHPPVHFVAEIGSLSNTREVITAKRGRYAAFVHPLELLETHPIDEEEGEVLTPEHLQLYRLTGEVYEQVTREPNGRFRSEVLGLEIGVDEVDNLRLYTLDGERVLTYEEEMHARLAAEQRADREARERAAAEQRADREARERTAAEQRAGEERAQREALERELAALRARLSREEL